MAKTYFIYLDVLGFICLARDIATTKGIESRKVREDFLSVIREAVETTERKGRIVGKCYGGKDDWLLVTDSLDKVFQAIFEILNHNTGYRNYERVPLEIAVGTAEFDKWARPQGEKLIIEETTVEFLTSHIVDYYRKWYRQHCKGRHVKSTFVALTESVYQELEPLDRKMCRSIEYGENHGRVRFFIAEVDRVQQRGRVFEFLERIGRPGSKWYDRIDYTYVRPSQYEDIKRKLEKKRLVFITGTQEYGKTYTAVRLMWEYYNRGYVPRWISGAEKDERLEVRKKLENMRGELKPKNIIYFEDPFGRTQYEEREELEREIGILIESIDQVKDAYVVITSREEVFKEFERRKLSGKELKEFENRLNIKKPSYDYQKRKQLLVRWAEKENCSWLKNETLRNLVLESIEHNEILPTPLSIRDFVLVTRDTEKEDELKDKMTEKSVETQKAFAREIENMTDDKILFLLFMLVSGPREVQSVRENYQELVEELNLKGAWEFHRIVNWFKDDKIELFWGYVGFRHSSYSESVQHLLIEDGYPTRINKNIFCELLLKLSEKHCFFWEVVRIVDRYFEKLPKDTRNSLLLKLSEKGDGTIARILGENFDNIGEDVRNESLLNLAEKDGSFSDVLRIVSENFGEFQEDAKKNLLIKLFQKDRATWGTWQGVIGMAQNSENLPEHVRNLLIELQQPLQRIVRELSVGNPWDKQQALYLIPYISFNINRDFLSEVLSQLNKCENKTVGVKAAQMLKALFPASKPRTKC